MSYTSIGFIGVGAMGKEMVLNLAKKLPANIPISINDVNESVTKELATTYPDKVYICDTAHDVAQASVCIRDHPKPGADLGGINTVTGHSIHDAPRRASRPHRLCRITR